ncbi:MAG TPA: hypothetical protein DC054_21180 [Blastocatellia bacterium]|nr:hypothetical protein [Blastocatellia bacterium]
MADGLFHRFAWAVILEKDAKGNPQIRWDFYQALALILGVVFLSLYAWKGTGEWRTFPISLMIAAASVAAGLFLGFLFGIPKINDKQVNPPPPTGNPPPPGGPVPDPPARLKPNSNLVEISDWLTKMIVGVGLFQLSKLPGNLRLLAEYMADAFGKNAVPSALVITILCYFSIFGFLLGYLWARIYLMKELPID